MTKLDMRVWTNGNHLFRKTIFRPIEDAAPVIFIRDSSAYKNFRGSILYGRGARDWPRVASAHPSGDGVPPTIFNNEHSKISIKFSVCAPITSGLMGVTSQNFSTWLAARRRHDNLGTNFLGTAPLKFGKAKTSKFGVISDNFRLWSRIPRSGTDRDIENRENKW